jgi:hypothetical protein
VDADLVKIERLFPRPTKREQFAWSHHSRIPAEAGCYALATFGGEVLYVGLATVSVRDRMGKHLDTKEKRSALPLGTAFWFYYLLRDRADVASIERGWMNQAVLETGSRPPLNKIDSPL